METVNKEYLGVPASPGICIGKAYLVGSREFQVKKTKLTEAQVEKEMARLQAAIDATRKEIQTIKQRVGQEVGFSEAEIFNAYLHILQDPLLIQAAMDQIRASRINAEYILQEIAKQLIGQFKDSPDEYLQERATDINDVVARLLRNLTGQPMDLLSEVEDDVIVVAKDLTPSQTATMRRERVIGFTTDIGGKTSHAAIMARSLELPAVVGLKNLTEVVQNGSTLIVDGTAGIVLINPNGQMLAKYRHAQQRMEQWSRKLKKLKGVTAVTKDGYRLTVAANIELPEDVRQARKYGAEGIGLFRTEFLFLNRRDLPGEDEQFEVYQMVARQSLPYTTIIRTLDLGGDKFLSRLGTTTEMNPFLGLRGIRLCLAHQDLFKVQLRAVLRASHFGKIKIMFPMVSCVEEMRQAKALLREAQKELGRRRVLYDRNMEVGLMIELPSAAMTADILARESNFFSIGTNDLIQYTLAADRINEKVAYLYNPLHPAILRLIRQVVQAGHNERIWVGMCGEMAADPQLTPLLVGLGLDEFSTGPAFVPQIKKGIREVNFAECRELAEKVMACTTSADIEALLKSLMKNEVLHDSIIPKT
ncbi:phosphoenolpyruvate--protein phosphotransferase [candidate division FCPU426 bacterium]|nr:phosphoenolpyruvate--protein phosphotransferase [candidate division FCPU426 bacterium]